MRQATFNIRTGKGLEQREGWLADLPGYEIPVCLHQEGKRWVCSEYETGAAFCVRGRSAEHALAVTERKIDHNGGTYGLLRWMSAFLYSRGRANEVTEEMVA